MDSISVQLSQVKLALQQGKWASAASLALEITELQPTNASAWYCHSAGLLGCGEHNRALSSINKACQLVKTEPTYLLHKIKVLAAQNQITQATAEAIKLKKHMPAQASWHSQLGLIFNQLQHYHEALAQFQQAGELAPKVAVHHYNQATVLRFLGRFQEAQNALLTALEHNPDDHQAWGLLSDLKKQTLADNHISPIRAALQRASKPVQRVTLNYALGKALEDIGDDANAFKHWHQGATLRRRHLNYNVEDDLQIMTALQQTFTAETLTTAAPQCSTAGSEQAIFILGMPRTGSTLIERMLSNHCQVSSCGETHHFSLQMIAQLQQKSVRGSPLSLIPQTLSMDFTALGDAYLKALAPKRGSEPMVIDKLPFNYLYIGLIHLALPNARIIHVKRHPVDTCLAIYKRLFENAYPFSYDLKELASYYIGYERLMSHWHAVLPGKIHSINYESVVTRPEAECRRLLDYCGLNWQSECTDITRNINASTTASASQVREPIYQSSTGHWKRFRRNLQPLIQQLQEAGLPVSSA